MVAGDCMPWCQHEGGYGLCADNLEPVYLPSQKKLSDLCIVAIIKTIALANTEASHFRENIMSDLWNNILYRTAPVLTKLIAHLHSVLNFPVWREKKATAPECGSQPSTNLHLPPL